MHIARCRKRARPRSDRYVQRELAGVPLSMTGIVSAKGAAFAFVQPLLSPISRRLFRFGGVAGSIDIDADLEARLIEIGLDVARAVNLVGLVSYDLVITDQTPALLEVNPRPGAALDIFDDENGTLFAAHLAAVCSQDPAGILAPVVGTQAALRAVPLRRPRRA